MDIMIGQGPTGKSIRINLPKFTLIGATTRAGSLTTPLRDRFGIVERLELYDIKDLAVIVKRSAGILNIDIDEDAADEIAKRSRGTPRIANRLLKRLFLLHGHRMVLMLYIFLVLQNPIFAIL